MVQGLAVLNTLAVQHILFSPSFKTSMLIYIMPFLHKVCREIKKVFYNVYFLLEFNGNFCVIRPMTLGLIKERVGLIK